MGKNMKQFEIFFDDLNQDAQKRYLEFMNMEKKEDGNFEICPLAIIEYDTEETK